MGAVCRIRDVNLESDPADSTQGENAVHLCTSCAPITNLQVRARTHTSLHVHTGMSTEVKGNKKVLPPGSSLKTCCKRRFLHHVVSLLHSTLSSTQTHTSFDNKDDWRMAVGNNQLSRSNTWWQQCLPPLYSFLFPTPHRRMSLSLYPPPPHTSTWCGARFLPYHMSRLSLSLLISLSLSLSPPPLLSSCCFRVLCLFLMCLSFTLKHFPWQQNQRYLKREQAKPESMPVMHR